MKQRQVNADEVIMLGKLSLGERLKWLREQLQELSRTGFTINQVAKNLNHNKQEQVISPQGLSAIEMGKTKNPTATTINSLAEYYRIPSEILFDDYYINKGTPFTLGDVVSSNFQAAAKQTVTCHISIFADDEKLSETLKLTPQQLERLMKRIKFEVSLLMEEQN
jgi:transcriptional regulator with XRE-family HTH domain